MIREDWSTLRKLTFMSMIAGGKLVEDTATGNPLTFITDVSKPLRSLLIPFTPVQSGSGDPSPQNVRPIVPWEGLKVNQCGKNLADFVDGKGIASDGTIGDSIMRSATVNPIQIKSGASYIFTADGGVAAIIAVWNGETLVRRVGSIGSGETLNTSGGDHFFVCIYKQDEYATVANNKPMVRLSTESAEYEPYVPITDTDISFPSPVYGGTLDVVSGVLTVTHVCVEVSKQDFTISGRGAMPYRQTAQAYAIQHKPKSRVDWAKARQTQKMDCAVIANPYSETTFGNYIGVCFYDTNLPTAVRISQDLYDSLLDGDSVYICYEIEDPFDVQLTGAQITAIVGNNTIWSDADGSMTAVYLKKG